MFNPRCVYIAYFCDFILTLTLLSGGPAHAGDPLWKWLADPKNYSNTHVVADLDETLVDSTPRRYAAYRSVVKEPQLQGISLMEFYRLPNRYRTAQLFENHLAALKLEPLPQKELANLGERVYQEYTSGRHLERDSLIPGAWQVIRMLEQAGAILWFVSARTNSTQRRGTLESLHALGLLPSLAETDAARVLLLEPGQRSTHFKREITARIAQEARQQGSRVSLILENEPENLEVMLQAAPDARAVLLTGAMTNPKHPIPEQAWQRSDYLETD